MNESTLKVEPKLDVDPLEKITDGMPDAEHRDPMLVCLALLAKLLDREVHVSSLRAGFAVDETGRIPLSAYPDLTRLHGLIGVWNHLDLRKVRSYVLPIIVPFIDGRACVLLSVKGQTAMVLMADSGMTEIAMSMSDLEALSSGDVLTVKAAPQTGAQQLVPFKGRSFDWFWRTVWRFKGFYFDAMCATVVANLLTLAAIFFTMNVYDRVVPTQAYTSLWTLAIGTTLAITLEFAMRWLKARLVDLGGKKTDLAINATLLREIMSIRLEHRPQSIGIFASSVRDFEALRDFFSSASLVLLADMPFIIVFLVLIGVIAGPLVWIPAAVVPILILVGILAQPSLMRAIRRNMKESGDKQSVLVESLLNLELLKAHNAESYLQRRWEKANLAGAESYTESRALTNFILGLTTTAQQLVTVFMVVFGVYLIGDNQLTLGGLIAAVILAGRAIAPLGSVMALATRYQQAASALDTLDQLIKRPRDREEGRRYIVPDHYYGGLSAMDVDFSYPGEHIVPVIKKATFTLQPGDHLALLGRVGSGKSTLIRLLSGLYAPTAGAVLVDGVDQQQLEPAELRSHIAYIGQDPQLFMGTIRENLILSDSWISDSKIIEILKQLDLYSLVANHPRGLDMPLTEAGGGLSGGQRQLLALARMMLRDPRYVFMDEPTSNMDQNTEARVISVLGEWLTGRTMILATHRIQLLVWVNRVAVLERGEILMEGPRDYVVSQLKTGISTEAPPTSASADQRSAANSHSAATDTTIQDLNPALANN
jgi:ATP-binding cassette subfamily C protein LapB